MAGVGCRNCGADLPNPVTMLCYSCDPQYNQVTGGVTCKVCFGPTNGTEFCTSCCNAVTNTKTALASKIQFFTYPKYSFMTWGAELEPLKPIETIQSTTPIVGYRVWNLDRKDCKLVSCVKKYPWPLRRRLCRDLFDNAGIHAVKNTYRLVGSDSLYASAFGSSEGLWREYDAEVAGSIYMWGEVKECSEGYLAEFAYPKQLWMPEDTDPTIILQLEENYGVPCDLSPHFKKNDVAEKFPTMYTWTSPYVTFRQLLLDPTAPNTPTP